MSERITRESFRSAFLLERERLRQKQIPIDAADVMALLEPLFVEREKSEALHATLIAATEVVTMPIGWFAVAGAMMGSVKHSSSVILRYDNAAVLVAHGHVP